MSGNVICNVYNYQAPIFNFLLNQHKIIVIMSNRRSNILLLKGIFSKDFSNDPVIYNTEPKLESVYIYTEIPRRFTGVLNWPQYSNLRCWHCNQIPTEYPKFIPMDMERTADGEIHCDVRGHFCCWNCAVRYVVNQMPQNQRSDLIENICHIESKFTGKRRYIIPPAPDKTEMQAYCGAAGLTPKQWYDKLAALDSEYELIHYKLEHFRGPRK